MNISKLEKRSAIGTFLYSIVGLYVVCFAAIAASNEPDLPQRFDYHSIRGRQASGPSSGILEGEDHLVLKGKSRVQAMSNFGNGWSGNAHLLWDGKLGEAMETSFRVERASRYRLGVQLTDAPDYGIFSIHLNDKEIHKGVDTYANRVQLHAFVDLGEMTLKAGQQKLVFKLTSANAAARKFRGAGYLMGLDYLKLVDIDPLEKDPGNDKDGDDPKIRVAEVKFDEVKPIIAQFCIRCHGGGKEIEGELDLRKFVTTDDFLNNIKVTQKILKAIDQREMPPEDEKQPSEQHFGMLSTLMHSYIDQYVQASSELSPVVMRRLNRYEYNNAVRDLMGLRGDVYPLPEKTIRPARKYFNPASGRYPDAVTVGNRTLGKNQVEKPILTGVVPYAIDLQSEHGFNNRGDELSVSPILFESFLKLGSSIVNSPEFDRYCTTTATFFNAPPDLSVEQQVELARERLSPWLEAAFRSRVDRATEDRYVDYFARQVKTGKSFSASMKGVVGAVLASPRFLYVTEQKHVAVQTKELEKRDAGRSHELQLDDYELATRLSFFLWSSIPDKQLLDLARKGELQNPDVLETQIHRMLEDPKSQALATNFARQWLRIDQLITAVPDFDRFQVYYSRIGCEQWKFGLQTMVEPLLLFESIMVEDRSIMLLIDCNYSFRSDELQSWYKDATPFAKRQNRNRFNTNQQSYRRRPLDTRREGGIITSAATLTMTSSPLRTSPITRGAWVATVIFNQPPPPPPDTVPSIEEDDAKIEATGQTLRQRLKQHQSNKSCVSCHAKIDPLGFALENYDAVGRWREKYSSGLPIDSSGELFGKEKFTDVVELKDAILKHPEWFMRAFGEHLLSYALGRELEIADKPAVDRILREVMKDRGKFSTVVVGVAKSYPFLHKADQRQETSNAK
jgi:hypothetical protein